MELGFSNVNKSLVQKIPVVSLKAGKKEPFRRCPLIQKIFFEDNDTISFHT